MAAFAPVVGRERWSAGTRIPRHRHAQAYAAIVLSGGYEECGSQGRFRVRAGDVLLHGAFDAHLDRFDTAAGVLNLPLDGVAFGFAAAHVRNPDALARLAERDGEEAAASLLAQLQPAAREPEHWPDRLACALRDDPAMRLDLWAEEQGLAPATVSRGFGRVFGVSPCVFRAEARVRRVLAAICESALPLAGIAASHGFADQAHMTRAVSALTGLSPGRLRSNGFKTVLH
jgi:AraC-like DNA-binding protein